MERQAKDGTFYQQVGPDQWSPVTREAKDGTVYKKVGDDQWSPMTQETKSNVDSVNKNKSVDLSAGLEGFGEGVSLGYLNNIQAATEKPVFKILNMITGEEVQPDDYLKARDYYNKRQEGLQKESPKSFTAGNIAGTVASSLPIAKAAQGATMLARAGQAAKAGAAYGALQNTSETEGEMGGIDLGERLLNSGSGAVIGAASSLGADAVAKGFSKASDVVSSQKNKIGQYFKKSAEKLAENATGATRVQSEKFSDDAGRFLLDNGIVSFGDDAEKIAQKAGASIKKSENVIDDSLKALDEKGVTVSQDKIVEQIQSKIKELSKDSSQADVVKKLSSIVDDIINTGESNVSASAAEQTKRGFNKMAKNWQDPEKGQAGKVAYRAYRDAVEDVAKSTDSKVASDFVNAKQVYGKLNPIADAAEKRAAQLNQSPIGGLLDVGTAIGGGLASDDPLTGLASGVGMSLARRKIAPKIGSSLAVSFDKISKSLLSDPKIAEIAVKSPDAFKSLVFSYLKPNQQEVSTFIQKAASNDQPTKGPEKWANDGANQLQNHDSSLDKETLEKLKQTKKGRALLEKASMYKAGDKQLDRIATEVKSMTSEDF